MAKFESTPAPATPVVEVQPQAAPVDYKPNFNQEKASNLDALTKALKLARQSGEQKETSEVEDFIDKFSVLKRLLVKYGSRSK